jgi:DNA-binding transcriptional ArsR family regulator
MNNGPDKTLIVLGDIRTYLRITAASALRSSAAQIIDIYEKAVVFGKLDGNTSQQKLQEVTKVPQGTISRWISDFTEAGIVAPPDEIYKNHRALFSLRELGIDSTALKRRSKTTEPVIAVEAQ